jgi:DNA-binding NarL/FixJ family response regulator
MIRIFLADDHPLTRAGLKTWIEDEPDLELVAEAEDGESAWRGISIIKPDVALLEIEMPRGNGIEITERILKAKMPVRVVILTAYSSSQYVMAALRAGARGFILKTAPFRELRKAVHDVYEGGFYVDDSVPLGGENSADYGSLSAREKEVLIFMAQGLTAQDAAVKLSITERTVHAHLTSIYEKLKVKNKTEAILAALKCGIIFLDQLTLDLTFNLTFNAKRSEKI